MSAADNPRVYACASNVAVELRIGFVERVGTSRGASVSYVREDEARGIEEALRQAFFRGFEQGTSEAMEQAARRQR